MVDHAGNPAMYFPPYRFPLMMEFRRSRARWRATKSLQTGGLHCVRKPTPQQLPDLVGSPAVGVFTPANKGPRFTTTPPVCFTADLAFSSPCPELPKYQSL